MCYEVGALASRPARINDSRGFFLPIEPKTTPDRLPTYLILPNSRCPVFAFRGEHFAVVCLSASRFAIAWQAPTLGRNQNECCT